jgi:hypothetical protein
MNGVEVVPKPEVWEGDSHPVPTPTPPEYYTIESKSVDEYEYITKPPLDRVLSDLCTHMILHVQHTPDVEFHCRLGTLSIHVCHYTPPTPWSAYVRQGVRWTGSSVSSLMHNLIKAGRSVLKGRKLFETKSGS